MSTTHARKTHHNLADQHPPLSAAISGGTLKLGGTTVPFDISPPITDYHGEQLFLKAVSDGATLSIVVDDVGPGTDTPPRRGAQNVTITVSYKDQMPAPWSGPCVYNQQKLTFALDLPAHDFATASLEIGEEIITLGDAPAQLAYIVVADPGDDTHVSMSWIVPQIPIPNYASLAGGTIVKPFVPPPGSGGILGPLGLELT